MIRIRTFLPWGIALCCMIMTGLVIAQSKPAPAPAAKPSPRTFVNLPAKAINAPFSDGVLVGNQLFLAGRIGVDPKTGTPPADLEQEIRIMLDGIKHTLAASGMTMDNLVWVQVFCSDVGLFDKFNPVYRSYFGKDYPARAFVGSGTLLRGGHFEMNAIAVK